MTEGPNEDTTNRPAKAEVPSVAHYLKYPLHKGLAAPSPASEEGMRQFERILPHTSLRGKLVLVLVMALAIGGYLVYQRWQNARNQRAETQEKAAEQEVRNRILQFARQHDAVTDWRIGLSKRRLTDKIYSAELSPIFVNDQGRPILFVGSVQDVSREAGESYGITFQGKINIHTNFMLQLTCNRDQATMVMASARQTRERFAIVARVISVGSTREESISDGEGTHKKAVSDIDGECIDVMPLGAYFGDYSEIISTFQD